MIKQTDNLHRHPKFTYTLPLTPKCLIEWIKLILKANIYGGDIIVWVRAEEWLLVQKRGGYMCVCVYLYL